MSDTEIATPARRHRCPMVAIRPTTIIGATRGNVPYASPYKGRKSGELIPLMADVLALLEVRPRDCSEVAEALAIEWPTAAWHLDRLVRRGLAVEAGKYPTTWEATA